MVADVALRYGRALRFLSRLVDWERRAGLVFSEDVIRLDLFRKALSRIGNPERSYRTILVAGTKGKGSTALLLSELLRAHGFKTGLFVSPHVSSIRERIRVDGQLISRSDFADAVAVLQEAFPYFRELGESRTFFESVTAAGFLHFQRKNVDIAVLEVGLGGRLDATNVASPDLSIITPISRDHLKVLGRSLIAIAGEKAGVIRRDRPLLIGKQRPPVRSFLQSKAAAEGAHAAVYGKDFRADRVAVDGNGTSFRYRDGERTIEDVRLGLLGEHQAWNAATALAALPHLGVPPSEDLVRRSLRGVQWPGRGEMLSWDPPILLDGAHNGDSAAALVRLYSSLFPEKRCMLLFGGCRGKEFPLIFRRLIPITSEVVLTGFDHPRSAPPDDLAQVLRRADGRLPVHCFADSRSALAESIRLSRGRPLLITGSLYLAGEVRRSLPAILAPRRSA